MSVYENWKRKESGMTSEHDLRKAYTLANKLADTADTVCTEWLKFGNVKPDLIKRLQLCVDDYYEFAGEND